MRHHTKAQNILTPHLQDSIKSFIKAHNVTLCIASKPRFQTPYIKSLAHIETS
ncbi:hypothetical protein [Helicobacter labetoulli]|uniref:hypothetical protein n=1 Tax=Helicobacter labetoulli TaxID=2315333 RepID=UPI0013005B30|nr:hypothetical protein [Helicobacter labetoulli]